MSRRGSAQLLLLFLRSRARLGWTLGALVSVLVVAGLIQAGGDFPILAKMGVAQMIRQSAWHHALAGMPEQAVWPWSDTPAATDAKVPRLGLSAAVGKAADPVIEPSQPAGDTRTSRAPSSARWASATASPSPPPTVRHASIG